MKVDHQKHVESGDQKVLKGVKRSVLETEVAFAILEVEREIPEKPVKIELSVTDARVHAVAFEVVHPVRIELA